MKKNLNHLWATLIVEELIRQGIDTFSLSPGSRSTPLVTAIAEHPAAEKVMHYDERGAAFFALGYGRAMQKPAVVVCSSGSAVANYLPALVEASMDHIPLIVITADRPPELLKCGANQAIDQQKIFGDYVREFFDLPCPTKEVPPEHLLTTVDQAVYRASKGGGKGPVHINCHYREPLHQTLEERDDSNYMRKIESWLACERPYTTYHAAASHFRGATELAKRLVNVEEGMIVVGRLDSCDEKKAAVALAEKLRWPLFPDITSGLRLDMNSEVIVPFYDQILQATDLLQDYSPELVLHIGGQMTSKRLLHFLKKNCPRHYLTVKDDPLRHDPDHLVTERFECDVATFCREVAFRITKREKENPLLNQLREFSEKIEEGIESFVAKRATSEIATAYNISKEIPEGHALFLASSLSIRHMDMFATALGKEVKVASSRGASGIDGTIATACGYALGLDCPVTLLVGDLAFLHDLNSLAYLNYLSLPLTIVVVNNKGGGIFSFLPVADQKNNFKTYFETPHPYDFSSAAEMFGLPYQASEDFITSYREAIKGGVSSIIEVRSSCARNFCEHAELRDQLKDKLVKNGIFAHNG